MAAMGANDNRGPVNPLGVGMGRMGSGTTWIPDAIEVPSLERMAGGWHLVSHGFLFAQYDYQGGARGASQLGSLNWLMLMASHNLAGGRVQLRTMASLEAGTVGKRGYPLLLQTGESVEGEPLHDRQHPHDFWMELGVLYERAVTRTVGISLFAAPSGEPALGPVAFMHRPSAMDDPMAPISHHWQDATHISFGVLTAGLFGHAWKLEASYFNGREPDEERLGFDRMRLDSWSGRLTLNPSANVSATVGYGYLRSPEEAAPDEPLRRLTGSLLYGRKLGLNGQLAAAFVAGRNTHDGRSTDAFLAEGEAILDRYNTVFARAERVEKSGEDLFLPIGLEDTVFSVTTFSLGYIREIARWRGATIGLGVRGSVNLLPAALAHYYGSRSPMGGALFLRLRPARRSGDATSEMRM